MKGLILVLYKIVNRFLLFVSNKRILLPRYLIGKTNHGTAVLLNSLLDGLCRIQNSSPDKPMVYLEIGIWQGFCLEAVNADIKVGVDPVPRCYKGSRSDISIMKMTSDQYFAEAKEDTRYDLIFIDGLHDCHQVYRDLYNSLSFLETTGIIILDDVWPENEISAKRYTDLSPEEQNEIEKHLYPWFGDTYLVLLFLLDTKPLRHLFKIEIHNSESVRQAILRPLFLPQTISETLIDYHSDFVRYEELNRNKSLWKTRTLDAD